MLIVTKGVKQRDFGIIVRGRGEDSGEELRCVICWGDLRESLEEEKFHQLSQLVEKFLCFSRNHDLINLGHFLVETPTLS